MAEPLWHDVVAAMELTADVLAGRIKSDLPADTVEGEPMRSAPMRQRHSHYLAIYHKNRPIPRGLTDSCKTLRYNQVEPARIELAI
jgi:hypothetical protein